MHGIGAPPERPAAGGRHRPVTVPLAALISHHAAALCARGPQAGGAGLCYGCIAGTYILLAALVVYRCCLRSAGAALGTDRAPCTPARSWLPGIRRRTPPEPRFLRCQSAAGAGRSAVCRARVEWSRSELVCWAVL